MAKKLSHEELDQALITLEAEAERGFAGTPLGKVGMFLWEHIEALEEELKALCAIAQEERRAAVAKSPEPRYWSGRWRDRMPQKLTVEELESLVCDMGLTLSLFPIKDGIRALLAHIEAQDEEARHLASLNALAKARIESLLLAPSRMGWVRKELEALMVELDVYFSSSTASRVALGDKDA